MYVNTFAGIRGVDPKLGELGQVLGLSLRELVTNIVLPGALPQALYGAAAERGRLAARAGRRRADQRQRRAGLHDHPPPQEFLENNIIMVCLIVYAILGPLAADALVRALERKALVWRRDFVQ